MADVFKTLIAPKQPAAEAKDKLAAKKQHEREVHDLLKQQQREKKEESKRAAAEKARLVKEERMLHDTRRAHTDLRRQQHREEHKETGKACEHGIWRCKICFPHASH